MLDDDGKLLPGARAQVPDAIAQRALEIALLVQAIDERMTARGGFHVQGDPASPCAIAPLRDTDWIFPGMREQGTWLWRGLTIADYVADPVKGRQLPGHHSADWLRIVSISTPAGTHIPQAVGAAYAAKVLGKDDVAVALFSAAAAASGDLHVGLNFAAVWKAPCVFVVRNATERRLAAKAVGYGMPAVRVDGADLPATWQAMTDAIDRARAGGGPTLVETVRGGDPIRRTRGYLAQRGLWSEKWEADVAARHAQAIAQALAAPSDPPASATMFEDVFEAPPWHLREQRERWSTCP